MKSLEVTPAISSGTAYASGDVVGGLLEFVGAPESGFIQSIEIIDTDNEASDFDIVLFNQEPTTIANDAAFAFTSGEEPTVLTKPFAIANADYKVLDSVAFARTTIEPIPFELDTANNEEQYIYAYFVIQAANTYTTAGDLTFRINVMADGVN